MRGRLTDEAGLIWRTILDVLGKPDPAKAGDGGTLGTGAAGAGSGCGAAGGGVTSDCGAADGETHSETECGCATTMRDDRSVGQRNHDALRDLGLRILRSGILPESGGAPVTIVVRADLADVVGTDGPDGPRPPDGLWQSEHGDLVRAETLMALAGDAEVVPVLFDRTRSDCQLFLGRTHRIANRAQRRALTARDGGCSFPHCTAPASWCEVHHVIAWAIGGLTDIDNLCLVCPFHHREFERRGWAVVMARGRPHWRPPTWVDPDQRMVINTVHHLPEIVFTVEGDVGARIRL